jgi:hypothetical protein
MQRPRGSARDRPRGRAQGSQCGGSLGGFGVRLLRVGHGSMQLRLHRGLPLGIGLP